MFFSRALLVVYKTTGECRLASAQHSHANSISKQSQFAHFRWEGMEPTWRPAATQQITEAQPQEEHRAGERVLGCWYLRSLAIDNLCSSSFLQAHGSGFCPGIKLKDHHILLQLRKLSSSPVSCLMLQTLRNLSVLKMAEAQQPEVPVRLYKPLNHWRLLWMRKKLDQAKELLGWSSSRAQAQLDRLPPRNAKEAAAARVRQQAGDGVLPGLSVVDPAYVARVKALAMTLRAEKALASS
jgi:hypothetical protein